MNNRYLLHTILIFSLGALIPILGSVTTIVFFSDTPYPNLQIHKAIGLMTVFLALCIFIFKRLAHEDIFNLKKTEALVISTALMPIIVLGSVFAIFEPDSFTTFLYSASLTLSALILCGGLWLSFLNFQIMLQICRLFTSLAIVTIAGSIIFKEHIPAPLYTSSTGNAYFYLLISAALGYLGAFIYFCYRNYQNRGLELAALSTILLALYCPLFMISYTWEPLWWWSQCIFLSSIICMAIFIIKKVAQADMETSELYLFNPQRFKNNTIKLISFLLITLGSVVIFGWYTNQPSLIQINPSFAPMQYNTATGFILCGIGLLIIYKNNILKYIVGSTLTIIGGLTLIQYSYHVDFGIDQLFMDHHIDVKTSHPGRMAPNTALCFTLTGLAIIFSSRKAILLAFGSTILTLGLLSISGYVFGNETFYGWGQLTRMALHTSIGFILTATGLTILSFKDANSVRKFDMWNVAPITIISVIIALTLVIWYGALDLTKERNQQYFYNLVDDTQDTLLNRFARYEQSLQAGVGLVYASATVERNVWINFVNSFNVEETLPGISGIGYIDYVLQDNLDEYIKASRADDFPTFQNKPDTNYTDKFIIKYIYPLNRNIEAVGLDIGFEANRREAAENSIITGKPTLTKKIILVQDHRAKPGFLLLIPVYKNKQTPKTLENRQRNILGWVYAPFVGEDFLNNIRSNEREHISFSVYDGTTIDPEQIIYTTQTEDGWTNHKPSYTQTTSVNIAGRIWTIQWESSPSFTPPVNRRTPYIILIMGIIFAVITGSLFQLLAKNYGSTAKKLAENRAKLELALESARLGSWNFNVKNQSVEYDERASDILGYGHIPQIFSREETTETVHPDDLEDVNQKFDEHLSGNSAIFTSEVRLRKANGDWCWILSRGKTVDYDNEGNPTLMSGTYIDITDIKAGEEEREKLIEELADSNEELERFAYVASHDLQEPLRMIRNFSQLLQENYAKDLDEQGQKFITICTDGAQRMQALIEDLLEYARIDKTEDPTEVFSGNKMLNYAIDNLANVIEEKQAKITCEDLPPIRGNFIRLSRVIQNLISNGIKYQKDGVKPRIQIKVREDGNFWEFLIKDNGIGMKPEYCEQIFAPFKRLHGKNEYSGTGIGLAICKKIINKAGGTIWANSAPDKGTTIYFTLPKLDDANTSRK